MAEWLAGLASLGLTYLLHSTVLLGAVALLDVAGLLRRLGAGEGAWRAALVGAWLSTALALAGGPQTWQPGLPRAAALVSSASLARDALPLVSTAAPQPAVQLAPEPARVARSADALRAWVGPVSLLWLTGAFVGLLALLVQTLSLRRRLQRLPLWPEPALQQRLQALAAAQGLPQPLLRRCAKSASPWAWAHSIVLPAWTAEALSPAQRQAVLAHELAHLARRDPLWRWLDQLAARLGWLQPLNRLALRRIEAWAEQACDQAAVRATGSAEALAQSLLQCAERLRRPATRFRTAFAMSSLSAAMAARRSPLVARLRLMLEPSTMNMPFSPTRPVRLALLASLLTAAVALPVSRLHADEGWVPDWLAQGFEDLVHGSVSGDSLQGGRQTLVNSSGPDSRMRLRWQGRLKLNADESDVESLEGPLRFVERHQGVLRSWTVEPQPDGSLRREYRVNQQLQMLDAEGQAWLKRLLAQAVEVGLTPAQRAQRYLVRGGVAALLADIDAADGDYTQRVRIEGALAVLPAAQQQDPAVLQALLQRASALPSAYERRLSLLALAKQVPVAQQSALLGAAMSMDSDYERASLLTELAPRLGQEASTQAAWLQLARSIGSEFERRRAIEAQLAQGQGGWHATLIEASAGMDGDFEQREALQAVVTKLAAGDTLLRLRALALSSELQSDFEASQLLLNLLQPGTQSPELLAALLQRTAALQETHERLQVLLALAPQMPSDGALDPAYRAAARGLPAHERGQVELAIER